MRSVNLHLLYIGLLCKVPHSIISDMLYEFSYITFYRLVDNPYYDYKLSDSTLYAYWAGCVIGPFVCILAVAHALLWGFPSAVVGSVVSNIVIYLYMYM